MFLNADKDGSDPAKLLFDKSSRVIEPLVQVIPNQLHSVPAAPNQSVLSVQLAPLVELYKAIKASRSICGIWAWETPANEISRRNRAVWMSGLIVTLNIS